MPRRVEYGTPFIDGSAGSPTIGLGPVYVVQHPEPGSPEAAAKAQQEAAQYVANHPEDSGIVARALLAFYGVGMLPDEAPW